MSDKDRTDTVALIVIAPRKQPYIRPITFFTIRMSFLLIKEIFKLKKCIK